MNYDLNIKSKIKNNLVFATQLLLLMQFVYVIFRADEHTVWKFPILVIGLLSWFFLQDKTKYLAIWIVFVVLLLCDLIFSYFWVANHHFMLLFMSLSVVLYFKTGQDYVLQRNIQIIVVLVIFTSVIQKLMSGQFMSGQFYYYMINRGSLFRFFINFFPEAIEIVQSNAEKIDNLSKVAPSVNQKVVLEDIVPNLGLLSQIYAWVTVVIELIVAIMLLLKPRYTLTHVLFTVMILGILCARFETGFMALLAICGIVLSDNLKLRLCYALITIACIVFMITKLGYY